MTHNTKITVGQTITRDGRVYRVHALVRMAEGIYSCECYRIHQTKGYTFGRPVHIAVKM